MNKKELKENCPEGYSVAEPSAAVDMLGAKELWLILKDRPDPKKIRIPQDLVDYGRGRVWGDNSLEENFKPLYYKLVK